MRLRAWLSVRFMLLAAALCLAAAGAGVIGAACDLVARDYLGRQTDEQLRGYADRLGSRPSMITPFSGFAAGVVSPGGSVGGVVSIEVRGSGGQLVMTAGRGTQPGPAIAAAWARNPAHAGQLSTVPAANGGGSWRVMAVPVSYRARRIPFAYSAEDFAVFVTSPARPGAAGTIVIGLDLGSISQVTGKLTVTCLAVSSVVILVIACLGAVVIRAILRPLTEMQETVTAVAAGELSRRVPERHARSDTGRLASSLNKMLSRIEHAFSTSAESEAAARQATARMRKLTADTALEIRTPLSVIRGLARYHRQRGQHGTDELDRRISRADEEAARIGVLVDRLLSTGHDQPRSTRR